MCGNVQADNTQISVTVEKLFLHINDFAVGAAIESPKFYEIFSAGLNVKYFDQGSQPNNIPTINKVLTLNARGCAQFGLGFQGCVEAGLADSGFSSSSAAYHPVDGFSGTNFGANMNWLVPDTSLQMVVGVNYLTYHQVIPVSPLDVSHTGFENMLLGNVGIKYNFEIGAK